MKQSLLLFIILITGASCKKYLEAKPDIVLAVPSTIEEYQQLLNPNLMITAISPASLGTLAADEYYITDATYNAQSLDVRNIYIWQKDPFQGLPSPEWAKYQQIYTANVVLEGVNSLTPSNAAEQDMQQQITGQALFIRAYLHYHLEEIFGQPYKPVGAATDAGIPLRLNANLAERARRSTVKAVFDQIVNDLNQAATLLPATGSTKNRPTRQTCYAMLSRVYLTMQNYQQAKAFADSALHINAALYDYNNLTITGTTRPFASFASPNDFTELLYAATQQHYNLLTGNTLIIDSGLYKSYAANDIRKTAYFARNASTGNYYYRGQYSGVSAIGNGPFTDELYLNRAECLVRLNNIEAALKDMDSLLIKRYTKNTYIPYKPATQAEALSYVLTERKKELILRGLRWTDLRRLNQETAHAVTLRRITAGKEYTLLPNGNNYTYPIPQEELQYNPLPQNPRD